MGEITADVIRNHVLALHVPSPAAPLSADELSNIQWAARTRHAALLNLPRPRRPGVIGKLYALALRAYAVWFDRRQYRQAIADQALRICELEDFIEASGLAVPGGRSDE